MWLFLRLTGDIKPIDFFLIIYIDRNVLLGGEIEVRGTTSDRCGDVGYPLAWVTLTTAARHTPTKQGKSDYDRIISVYVTLSLVFRFFPRLYTE